MLKMKTKCKSVIQAVHTWRGTSDGQMVAPGLRLCSSDSMVASSCCCISSLLLSDFNLLAGEGSDCRNRLEDMLLQ
jgi:hypothetical protein